MTFPSLLVKPDINVFRGVIKLHITDLGLNLSVTYGPNCDISAYRVTRYMSPGVQLILMTSTVH